MAEHDYVVVGAGSAGCVLANRLSADPSVRVLLLEAGGSDRNMNVRIPIGFAKQFRTDLDWAYTAEPDPNLIGRSMYLPRGRCLGGSSSMNAMIYMRGHRHDYDTWASELGAPGWSYDDVLPVFKRSEANTRLGEPYHGRDGELAVTDPVWVSKLAQRFVAAASQAAGVPVTDDFNGAEQDGASVVQVTQRRGRRWSAADAFLHPVRERPNLEVRTGAQVRRIVVEDGRATGVQTLDGAVERARQEVVVCAGAYNSPQLLMLSGIGPADHLREVGVEPVLDQPHVGAHLQDHPMATLTFQCPEALTLFDATHPRYLVEYLLRRGRGKLTSNVGEAGCFARVAPDTPAPDFYLYFGPAYYFDNGFRTFPGHAFTIAPSLVRPRSEGAVRLRSADPRDPPAIHLNFLSTREEMDAMVAAVRLAREIAGTAPLSHSTGANIDPGPGVASAEQLEAWIRAEVQHVYHAGCTCRMGPEDAGVLDEQLRVRGVEGLRVADASIFPVAPRANTNFPVMMAAEKIASAIARADT
ncbi:MAG: FAD-dependent oxidoreductase [Actinomycetota bacterium]|nr:FAD-dependent oxidoreductase [Actinomycetota bacterium]